MIREIPLPDGRFCLIAGIDQPTVVGLKRVGEKFEAIVDDRGGDGTVPRALAEMKGLDLYVKQQTHNGLISDRGVAKTIAQLIRKESPAREDRSATRSVSLRQVSYDDVREPAAQRSLEPEAIDPVSFFDGLTRGVAQQDGGTPAMGSAAGSSLGEPATSQLAVDNIDLAGLIVSRHQHHRLEISLAQGSITDVGARAYVLGVFQGVAPEGAAAAVDQLLDGAITEFYQRRAFTGEAGQIFIMPTASYPCRCEFVVLMGLGDFREFLGEEDGDSSNEVPSATIPVAIDSVESQRGARLADSSNRTSSLPSRVAMDLVQSLNRMGVDSIATILWGGGTIQQSHKLVGDILRGFLDAYSDVAMDRLHLRRVILCETNAVAYTELRKSLAMHLLSNRFRDGDFVLNEIRIRSSEQVRGEVRKSQQEKRPRVYLLATALDKDAVNNEQFQMELRLLGHAHKGAISADTIEVDRATISDFINQAKVDRRASLSKKFSEAFLGSRMVSDLSKSLDDGDPAIVVLHDDATASIPWELMGEKEPWAVKYGVSRTAIVDGTARFLQERRRHKVLHVLLAFSNPKEDLPGGEEELAKLAAVFAAKMDKGIQVTRLEPRESTKSRLLEELGSGNYDVFHYIGHAKFGERIGDQRGIYCKDKDYLTGKDLGQLRMLPTLVFLNACESVRTYRESKDEAKRKLVERQSEPRSEWEKNPSLALGLLQAGIAQLIGTYWSVGDDDAPLFAATLYQEILKGSSTGDAIRVARGALLKKPSVDWANYMHYGDPSFKIKDPTG